MTDTNLRTAIKAALDHFASSDIDTAARQLFSTLGYRSDRTVPTGSVEEFLQTFDTEGHFQPENVRESARLAEWKSVQLLFQITDAELSGQGQLFDANDFEPGNAQSYLFFALELTGTAYPRGTFANITRRINRLFPTPVMVLFKYGSRITIAVINRRPSKVKPDADVLGKVTLIQDINYAQPHPGHLDIIGSFSVPELRQQKKPIANFDQLHAAWEDVFNVELLNKRFYRELSSWYFWARQQVKFPPDLEPDDERRNATSVIRLLTRLIFCWFLKEKGLIPDTLFDKEELARHLKSLDKDDSTYYRAILQNLFFATLNQQMNVDGEIHRRFVTKERFNGRSKDHGVKNLYRYEDAFRDPAAALALFEDIPFLNGGLFACLDRADKDNKELYADGFSDNRKHQPVVPNNLFFAEPQQVDLSDSYGDKKFKKETVQGLIHILRRYKFTIAENTPVEQEIALDPELLGKVFENLLASYNPETGTTARKQTGSFYTPRPIVDYMVDESLKAYLAQELVRRVPGTKEADARYGLDILFAYTEKEHAFTPAETTALIAAIDACNILDPACGSGAFPMGILHKLVFILQKLDPENKQWHQRQVDKAEEIADPQARESAIQAINRDFEENAHDYGRKLYLIENCIYGVDIQPIAIQISKLRFFISLVCDQCTNGNRRENFGIKALPNLETKFVAANTLLKLDQPEGYLPDANVEATLRELERVRHLHFSADSRAKKLRLQTRDKELRQQLKEQLMNSLMPAKAANDISAWDPYDMFSVAQFFDPRWMFGQGLAEGFDIVIQNPPYVAHDKILPETLPSLRKYAAYEPFCDLYCYFIERSISLLRIGGFSCALTSNSYLRADYGQPLRTHLIKEAQVQRVVSIDRAQVFANAIVNVAILHARKLNSARRPREFGACRGELGIEFSSQVTQNIFMSPYSNLRPEIWRLLTHEETIAVDFLDTIGPSFHQIGVKIRLGLATGHNDAFIVSSEMYQDLTAKNPHSTSVLKPVLRGRDIQRYREPVTTEYLILSKNGVDLPKDYPDLARHLESFGQKFKSRSTQGEHWWNLRACAFYEDFLKPKIVWIELTNQPNFAICPADIYLLNTAYFMMPPSHISPYALVAYLNSAVVAFYMQHNGQTSGMGTIRWIKSAIMRIKIPCFTKVQASSLETLGKLCSNKSNSKDTQAALERLIDIYLLNILFPHSSEIINGYVAATIDETLQQPRFAGNSNAGFAFVSECLKQPVFLELLERFSEEESVAKFILTEDCLEEIRSRNKQPLSSGSYLFENDVDVSSKNLPELSLFTSADEAPARRYTPKAPPATDIVVEIERRTTIEDITQEESLARIRKVFEAAGTREGAERDEALKDLSRQLGFKRLGSNIREELESDLRTAVRRRIIERVNGDGTYRLATRSIEDYLLDPPDPYSDLRRYLCAAIGRTWTDEAEAIRKTARYLGFGRVGDNIARGLKSAIRSGLLKRELERDGNLIRAAR